MEHFCKVEMCPVVSEMSFKEIVEARHRVITIAHLGLSTQVS